MTICRIGKSLSILIVLVLFVSLTTGFQDASNSPRAKRISAYVEANNSGKPEVLKEFMKQNCIVMDDEKFKKLHNYLTGFQKEFGKLTIEGLARASDVIARARLKPSSGSDSLTLMFEFDPNDEWKIISIAEAF